MSDRQVQQTVPLCPSCGDELVGEYGYVQWCRGCKWNVTPKNGVADPMPNRLGRFIHSDQPTIDELYDTAIEDGLEISPRGEEGVVALAFSLPVHAFALVFGVLGLALIVSEWFAVLPFIFGALLIGMTFGLYSASQRKPDLVLRADECGELRSIIAELAEALDAPPVRRIAIDRRINASAGRRWFANELTIGYPLWCMTDDDERLGILAHELSHFVNGDSLRSRPIRWALIALSNWNDVGQNMRRSGRQARGLSALASVAIGSIIAVTTRWYGAAILKLLYSQSQRCEYRADLLAARAVGTSAVVAGLTSLQRETSVELATRGRPKDPWQKIRDRVAALPASERERHGLKARADTRAIPGADTHPPVGYRIGVLEAHPTSASVFINRAQWQAADRQLAKAASRLPNRLER